MSLLRVRFVRDVGFTDGAPILQALLTMLTVIIVAGDLRRAGARDLAGHRRREMISETPIGGVAAPMLRHPRGAARVTVMRGGAASA